MDVRRRRCTVADRNVSFLSNLRSSAQNLQKESIRPFSRLLQGHPIYIFFRRCCQYFGQSLIFIAARRRNRNPNTACLTACRHIMYHLNPVKRHWFGVVLSEKRNNISYNQVIETFNNAFGGRNGPVAALAKGLILSVLFSADLRGGGWRRHRAWRNSPQDLSPLETLEDPTPTIPEPHVYRVFAKSTKPLGCPKSLIGQGSGGEAETGWIRFFLFGLYSVLPWPRSSVKRRREGEVTKKQETERG